METQTIRDPWCSNDKVGDIVIYGTNHSYSKWKIVAIEAESDGFKVRVLERIN